MGAHANSECWITLDGRAKSFTPKVGVDDNAHNDKASIELLVYGDFKFATIAHVEPALYPRTLTVNGVSKTYCMTGWRIGYAAGPKEIVKGMSVVQSHSTTNPASISQYAAVEALTGPQDFVARHLAAFARRRDFVVEALNAVPCLKCHKPEGAFYVYPGSEGVIGRRTPEGATIGNDEDFVRYLLETAGVGLVFGAAFGMSFSAGTRPSPSWRSAPRRRG